MGPAAMPGLFFEPRSEHRLLPSLLTMTAEEVYELTTNGGATDFARVVALCRPSGGFCLIGGLAVNCYVEPVYTLDADFVVVVAQLENLRQKLEAAGFSVSTFPNSMNAQSPKSQLRVQFTTGPRYQDFPSRAEEKLVLGVQVPVAKLEDVFQGKLWAYSDPARRRTTREKDRLDLIRLAESYSELRPQLPEELRDNSPA